MPAPQLLTAGIEVSINHLLALDNHSAARLKPLAGQTLQLSLAELPWPLTFAFSQKVDVMSQRDIDADCCLALSLGDVVQLQDSSNITQMIQQKKLELTGKLEVAQGFSQLLKELNIDWEQQLSRYTGDVIAHQFFHTGHAIAKRAQQGLTRLGQIFSEGMIEEKKLTIHPIEMEDFSEQVNQLRTSVARLEAKISQKEQN